jgi:hypothetical protein
MMLPVLGGDVPAAALVGDESGGRGEHHDRAIPARDEFGQQGLRHVQRADDVDLVHRQPVRRSRVRNRIGAYGAAGVVDEDIAAIQGLGQRVDSGTVGDVEMMGVGPAAALPDPLRERLDSISPAGREHHVVPGLGEFHRRGGPDPAACSGDNGCSLHG